MARHHQKWTYPRPLASAPHATKSVHGSVNARKALFSDLNSQSSVCHSTYATATTNTLCRSLFITLGWAVFGLLAYKVTTTKIDNKIYDPFEILGIKSVSLGCRTGISHWLQTPSTQYPCCTIHSYITFIHRVLRKRTSSLTTKSSPKHSEYFSFSSFTYCLAHYSHSHPDKVKLTVNDTVEFVAARFVEITKAYKAYAIIHEIYLI